MLIGAIAGAHGVRGEVRVRSFTAEPTGVVAYGPLCDADGRIVLTPQKWRGIKDALAVSAPEFTSREQAEAAKGTALYVPRDALPPPEDDEFYHIDLIGCRVEALDGAPLGIVQAVHDFGAGDVLEIRKGEATWYLEFSKDAAPVVDLTNRRIVATPRESEE